MKAKKKPNRPVLLRVFVSVCECMVLPFRHLNMPSPLDRAMVLEGGVLMQFLWPMGLLSRILGGGRQLSLLGGGGLARGLYRPLPRS